MPNTSDKRILVIRGGAIGDFILTLPALRALHERFPDCHIELMGYHRTNGLAAMAGVVQGTRSIESRGVAGFFARRGPFDPETSAYFASFTLILSYLFDPDQLFQNNIATVTKAQWIPGPHRPVENEPVHATDVLLRPLERLAIFDADPIPTLHLAREGSADTFNVWAFHPGSGSESKNWPESSWRQLLERVVGETDRRILLLGGEAEGDRLARLAAGLPTGRVEVLACEPLTTVAQRLSKVALMVGHDSGITHLAAAVGTPVRAIWGGTRADIWMPRHPAAKRIDAPREGLAALSVDTVWNQLD